MELRLSLHRLSYESRSSCKTFTRYRCVLIAEVETSQFSLVVLDEPNEKIDVVRELYFEQILTVWSEWNQSPPQSETTRSPRDKVQLSLLSGDDYATIKRGDVVAYWNTKMLASFHHYAVYIGNNTLIEFDGNSTEDFVSETTWEKFSQKRYLYILRSSCITDDMRANCVKSARTLLEEYQEGLQKGCRKVFGYNAIFRNCEHFAKYCLFGLQYEPSMNDSSEVFDVELQLAALFGNAGARFVTHFLSFLWKATKLLKHAGKLCIPGCGIGFALSMINFVTFTMSMVKQLYEYVVANGKWPSLSEVRGMFVDNASGLVQALIELALFVAGVLVICFGIPLIGAPLGLGAAAIIFILGITNGFFKNKYKQWLGYLRDDPPKDLVELHKLGQIAGA